MARSFALPLQRAVDGILFDKAATARYLNRLAARAATQPQRSFNRSRAAASSLSPSSPISTTSVQETSWSKLDDATARRNLWARVQRFRPLQSPNTSKRLSASFSTMPSLRWRARRAYSTTAGAETAGETKTKRSLSGRLKELTKKYGWATVVVYLLFSVVDFSLIFFAINLIGAEHVRRGQDYILDLLVYGTSAQREKDGQTPEKGNGVLGFLKEWRERHKVQADEHAENAEDAEKKGGSTSLWATAVLAYTIHKTLFLPVRIGLTAAATPAIVKQLQSWGINIARAPIPNKARERGAQAIRDGRQKLDRAKQRHSDWF